MKCQRCRPGDDPTMQRFTHVQQPRRSHICGQACVAIIGCLSLPDSLRLCTEGRQRRTSEHDLRRALATLGLALGPFERLPLVFPTPTPVLARVRFLWTRGYHWIVADGSTVYDPSFAEPGDREVYQRLLSSRQAYITSWAPVEVSR